MRVEKRARKGRSEMLTQHHFKYGVQRRLTWKPTSGQRTEKVREAACGSEFASGLRQRGWALRILH